ncbi:hypothetical protein [Ilyobacter polytropus]|uniref:Uncharacterized protein n=1 Tax=Ilyobacter polytropus (strain ATCC 51220 / DSM 2926 / LMG 16218 / CuHBu1) TaxID=572544 RepID=E3H8E8_ILYPC|nr:hypothetical protein [Ilyobacter polytropus]ADO82715.1 hypothetical protein Ilyop_0932 [Ilyobacter polytropus DSM 2926]
MKKIYLILASLLLIGNIGFARDVEIVKNSKDEEIVLKPDKTWETIDNYNRKSEFQKMVKVENLEVAGKRNQSRRVNFDVVNYSDYELEYVVYKIKILFADEYSLREIFTVRNIKPGEKEEVRRFINVEEVDGRDVVVDVFDFKMKTI